LLVVLTSFWDMDERQKLFAALWRAKVTNQLSLASMTWKWNYDLNRYITFCTFNRTGLAQNNRFWGKQFLRRTPKSEKEEGKENQTVCD
jgi:hypothetical protein